MGFSATVQKAGLDSFRVMTRPASGFLAATATNIFTVVAGAIRCIALTGIVVAPIAAGANTMTLHAPGAVAMDDGTVSINGAAAGVVFVTQGSVIVATSVVAAAAYAAALPWQCVPGSFTCTPTATTGTGTIQWNLAYLPLTAETIVVVA